MKKLSKVLTWDDLADEYDKFHGQGARKARTLPMDTIWDWAERKKELYEVNKKKGTIHKIITK